MPSAWLERATAAGCCLPRPNSIIIAQSKSQSSCHKHGAQVTGCTACYGFRKPPTPAPHQLLPAFCYKQHMQHLLCIVTSTHCRLG